MYSQTSFETLLAFGNVAENIDLDYYGLEERSFPYQSEIPAMKSSFARIARNVVPMNFFQRKKQFGELISPRYLNLHARH